MINKNKVNKNYLALLGILATVAAYAPGHQDELILNLNRSVSNISQESPWEVPPTPQAPQELHRSESGSEWSITIIPRAHRAKELTCSVAAFLSEIGHMLWRSCS